MNNREIIVKEVCDLNSETIGNTNQPRFIKYLDTGSITRNMIDNIQLLDRNIEPFPNRAQRKVKDKTIIYSTVRPIQEHFGFLVQPDENLIVSTGFITIDVKDDRIDSKFLYYVVTQKSITNYLQTIAVNNVSSYPSINPDDLGNLKFEIPSDKKLQQHIAAILTSIDAKIELNNRINAELEAMAKTLYDYWFVQFNFPNAKSKPYKSSGGKMVWNEELKREIPGGWDLKMIKEISTVIMGQSPKGESYNESGTGVPLLNGPADYENGSLVTRIYTTAPTRFCKKDDLVFCIRATIGNLTYAEMEFCLGRGVAAVRPKNKELSELVYYSLLQEIERFKIYATGSIIIGITKNDLTDSYFILPPNDLVKKFHNITFPIFDEQRQNKKQNLKLSELRDWLLPMLMNGQVKVN